MITLREQLIIEIDGFLRESGITPTAFGELVMADPTFVFRIKGGRSPTSRTIDKVNSFISVHRKRTARKNKRGKIGAAARGAHP